MGNKGEILTWLIKRYKKSTRNRCLEDTIKTAATQTAYVKRESHVLMGLLLNIYISLNHAFYAKQKHDTYNPTTTEAVYVS